MRLLDALKHKLSVLKMALRKLVQITLVIIRFIFIMILDLIHNFKQSKNNMIIQKQIHKFNIIANSQLLFSKKTLQF